MSDRSYTGPARDYTWNDIQDRPYQGEGETISITEVTDGAERVDWIPSAANPDHLTEKQLRVLKAASIYPTTSSSQVIADAAGTACATARRVLRNYRPHHPITTEPNHIPPEQKEYDDLTDRQREIIDAYLEEGSYSATSIKTGRDMRTVRTLLRQHEHIVTDRGGELPASQTPEKQYEDLTDLQQNVVGAIIDHPNASYSAISRESGASEVTVKKVLRKYGHVVQERGGDPSSIGNAAYAKQPHHKSYSDLMPDQQEIIDHLADEQPDTLLAAADALGVNHGQVWDTATNYSHILEERGVSVDDVTGHESKRREEKTWDDLTETQQRVVKTLADHPDATQTEIAEMVGCSRGPVKRVLDHYQRFVEERGASLDDRSVADGAKTREERTWDDLTPKQQDVIDAIVENPDASQSEIAEIVGCSRRPVDGIETHYQRIIDERRGE